MSEEAKAFSEEHSTPESMGNCIVEFFSSPINAVLLGVSLYILYRIVKDEKNKPLQAPSSPGLPPMKTRDFTTEELRKFNGEEGDGRILMAVNGKVFDVTRGKKFYGPGGPYGVFAGRDASRGLGSMSLDASVLKDGYDDLSDISSGQFDVIRDWETQFLMKYDHVGQLLKPGEQHSEYGHADDNNETTKND